MTIYGTSEIKIANRRLSSLVNRRRILLRNIHRSVGFFYLFNIKLLVSISMPEAKSVAIHLKAIEQLLPVKTW